MEAAFAEMWRLGGDWPQGGKSGGDYLTGEKGPFPYFLHYSRHLVLRQCPWRVSHFVSIGTPESLVFFPTT